MDADLTIRVSTRGLVIGIGAFAFFLGSTTLVGWALFASNGAGAGRRLGPVPLAVGGVCGLGVAGWIAWIVVTAAATRDRGLVRVRGDVVEVLTRRGHVSASVGAVTAVGLTGKHQALAIELSDGRLLHPVLRPEGDDWEQHLPALTERLSASKR